MIVKAILESLKDKLQFLKNDKNLYPYNCEKKEEFIKKGVGKKLVYLHFSDTINSVRFLLVPSK